MRRRNSMEILAWLTILPSQLLRCSCCHAYVYQSPSGTQFCSPLGMGLHLAKCFESESFTRRISSSGICTSLYKFDMATIAKCSWVSGSAWAAQSWEPLPKEGRTEADATWQTWSFGFRTWDICRSASECIGVPNGAFGSPRG